MSESKKIMILMGIIKPYTCEDKYSEKMKEYYLLQAKDSMPDFEWEIKEINESDPVDLWSLQKEESIE